jgi:hypothetical protein
VADNSNQKQDSTHKSNSFYKKFNNLNLNISNADGSYSFDLDKNINKSFQKELNLEADTSNELEIINSNF